MSTSLAKRALRALRHAGCGVWTARRRFPEATMAALETRIAAGEIHHRGEIRLAIEAALDPWAIWRGQTPRERALEVFGTLRVWDTAGNNGVLIYVLLADRAVEIVADRAASEAIDLPVWQQICDALAAAYRADEFAGGTLAAIDRINGALAAAFPAAGGDNPDELPNRPRIL